MRILKKGLKIMSRRRQGLLPGLFIAAALLAAIVAGDFGQGGLSQSAPVTSNQPVIAEAEPPAPAAPHQVSLPALMAKQFDGRDLKLGRVLEANAGYTRYYITYQSGALTISGIMNVPKGEGPFPALILNHGYIDPNVYTNGRGLRREQDYLARAGYVILHPDFRNHADSGKDERDTLAVRLGYVEDAINAVYALKGAGFSFIDAGRVGMLGHSMGGGVTLSVLVVEPSLVKAAALYAPVLGDMGASYERWLKRRPEAALTIGELYGTPETAPEFWANLSAENFYERVEAPVAIFHGTADESVPLDWSERTKSLLESAGKSVTLTGYEGAPHEFVDDWPAFMRAVKAFFDRELKGL